MQCIGIFLFTPTFGVVSIHLELMVVNNEEHMEIILLTCFEIESTVMDFMCIEITGKLSSEKF